MEHGARTTNARPAQHVLLQVEAVGVDYRIIGREERRCRSIEYNPRLEVSRTFDAVPEGAQCQLKGHFVSHNQAFQQFRCGLVGHHRAFRLG
jgi:hypothetical protein